MTSSSSFNEVIINPGGVYPAGVMDNTTLATAATHGDTAVRDPASLAMLAVGLGGMAWPRRRQHSRC